MRIVSICLFKAPIGWTINVTAEDNVTYTFDPYCYLTPGVMNIRQARILMQRIKAKGIINLDHWGPVDEFYPQLAEAA